jgi:hypothetical protein
VQLALDTPFRLGERGGPGGFRTPGTTATRPAATSPPVHSGRWHRVTYSSAPKSAVSHQQRTAAREKEVGVSYLARQAVSIPVQRRYDQVFADFKNWVQKVSPHTSWEHICNVNALLEQHLVEYMDVMFIESGRDVNTGTQLVASVGYHIPRLYHLGRKNLLPRVQQALRGWQRLAPCPQRKPVPAPLISAIACRMVSHGKRHLAALTMLAFDCYLRPGEAVSLVHESVIPPAPALGLSYRRAALILHRFGLEKASKTGQHDESLVLDSPSRPWVSELAVLLHRSTTPGRPLVPTSLHEWSVEFRRCAEQLRITHAHLYLLRHSGASDGCLTRRRTLQEIQKRGRWLDPRSVRRYEKAARAHERGAALPAYVQKHAADCHRVIGDVLLHRARPPLCSPVLLGEPPQKRRRAE